MAFVELLGMAALHLGYVVYVVYAYPQAAFSIGARTQARIVTTASRLPTIQDFLSSPGTGGGDSRDRL